MSDQTRITAVIDGRDLVPLTWHSIDVIDIQMTDNGFLRAEVDHNGVWTIYRAIRDPRRLVAHAIGFEATAELAKAKAVEYITEMRRQLATPGPEKVPNRRSPKPSNS